MIGFTAAYTGGEIFLDDEEIEDAGWFTADNLPRIPDKISIARKLIDWFLEKQEKSQNDNPIWLILIFIQIFLFFILTFF